MGAGEVASASWRWAEGHPRVALSFALPSPQWFSGIISFDGSWERQTYSVAPSSGDATILAETRRRVGLHVTDWSTSWLRWQTGASLDRLREYDDVDPARFNARDYLAVDGTIDVRLASDRLALQASADWWTPFAGGDRFGTGAALAAWRSTADATRPFWFATTEITVASAVAPLALWNGAGTGRGRGLLLRAHPLLSNGLLTGEVFGRKVLHGSFEYVQPVGLMPASGLAVAAFVDAARASRRLNGLDPSPLYVDVGVGVRLRAPGLGGVRIDLAHGLRGALRPAQGAPGSSRGGGFTLSASFGSVWPR